MERLNDIPFEHQMMFVLRNYDKIVAENVELRREVEELSLALEELGGNDKRKSLKVKVKKLEERNESLANKLREKNKKFEEVHHQWQVAIKKKHIVVNTLNLVKAKINKMLVLVDVPALRQLSQRITKDLDIVQHSNCLYETPDAV